jgi:ATP-dependent protease Clp ATPase subunit
MIEEELWGALEKRRKYGGFPSHPTPRLNHTKAMKEDLMSVGLIPRHIGRVTGVRGQKFTVTRLDP